MLYRHTTDHCFLPAADTKAVTRKAVDALLERLSPALSSLKSQKHKQATPLLALPSCNDDLPAIQALAKELRSQFDHMLVVGAGGSGLSGRTLSGLNMAAPVQFLENIDPDSIEQLVKHCGGKNPCFLIISKSGGTVETLAQFYVLADCARQRFPADFARRFIIITMPGSNPLRRAAEQFGMRVLDHAPDIGGRFSVFTNVGLLPAAFSGLDIAVLRKGAQSVVAEMNNASDPFQCQPAVGAALQYAFLEAGRNISVMLPYSERLSAFSSWYRQSWAESLGKGGKGSTPIRAVGTTDQHSQLQLYLDGPADKLFHLILLKRAGTGQCLPDALDKEIAYLQGRTTGDIMEAQQQATLQTLIRNNRPVRLFELDRLGEEELGALVMHFILEILFMAELLGVNAYDQPAVEESKQLSRDHLSAGL